LLLLVFATAWYVSGRLIAISHVYDTYPLRLIAVDADRHTVVLSRGPDAAEPGTFRLASRTGHATVGAVLSTSTGVTRQLLAIHGHLVPGETVGVEANPYTGDPWSALGLRYSTVAVPTPLGGMPAWYLPGSRTTWMILIHGLGGSRADTLPPMRTLHRLGYPMLAISYRNDVGAPPDPSHDTHLGAIEWHDVDAAVDYAMRHGASGVVLYGYSLGGAMALTTARRSADASDIRGLILDSPLLDWRATLDYAAERRGVPQVFMTVTEAVLAWRDGIGYGDLDQVAHEPQLRVPVLLFQGGADTIVPASLATRFARARPALVTYLFVPGADHVSAIDVDPAGYAKALDQFLAAWP
jgi:pimeloyl-ACP methyl ester carboxylesterase